MYSLHLICALVHVLPCAQDLSQSPALPQAQDESAPPRRLGTEVQDIDPRIWVMHQAKDGAYWFGSNGAGAYRHHHGKLTRFTREDGLAGMQVRDIQEDGQGRILISTNSGVSRFDGKSFETLEVVFAPTGSAQWKIGEEDVWLVFEPGMRGPCRYDGTKLYELELTGSPEEAAQNEWYAGTQFKATDIYSIHKSPQGHIWFGTASAGLCRFDGKSLSWMYEKRVTTTARGGEFGVRAIFEDRDGALWVCNTRQRFEISPESAVKDGFRVLHYETKPGLPGAAKDDSPNFTYYPSIIQDPEGTLWMACTSTGVLSFDGQEVRRFPLPPGSYAAEILRGRDGTLWVSTIEHGVHVLRGDTFEPFAPAPR